MLITPVENAKCRPDAAQVWQQYEGGTGVSPVDVTRKFGAWRRLGRKPDARDPHLAREAAALMTSQLFFAPLLAEMRKLPFGKRFGHGGRMEEAFGEQLDLRIADAVARSDQAFTAQLAERLGREPQVGRSALAAGQPTARSIPMQTHETAEHGENRIAGREPQETVVE